LDKITQLFYVSTYKELKLAVLIDADNVPYSNVKGMMEEITKFGTQQPNAFMQIGPDQMQMDGRGSS
jgi:hypothetical protein